LHVANQTETSFQLIDKITVGGKLTDVVYQFQKSKLTKLKYNYEKISIVTLALCDSGDIFKL
jgi:glutathione peroxidase-family protein